MGTEMPQIEPLGAGEPRQLGPFRVVGRIGEGGQGIVYLGTDESGGRVAIKLLHVKFSGDSIARSRFAREARAAQRVASFCTAGVVHVDLEGDTPYIASEYIEGKSLREVVDDSGPLRGAALQRLAVGTATALTAIHHASIVHRDFKPDNVLMAADGPRVVDFGIARIIDSTGTITSRAIGTPAYMAPEQISGDDVGPYTDVFAWGATIAFAATGEMSFAGDSIAVVLNRILNHEVDVSSMPEPLRGVVSSALAKNPAERPSADQILLRLLGHSETAGASPAVLTQGVQVASPEAVRNGTPAPTRPGTPEPTRPGAPEPDDATSPMRVPDHSGVSHVRTAASDPRSSGSHPRATPPADHPSGSMPRGALPADQGSQARATPPVDHPSGSLPRGTLPEDPGSRPHGVSPADHPSGSLSRGALPAESSSSHPHASPPTERVPGPRGSSSPEPRTSPPADREHRSAGESPSFPQGPYVPYPSRTEPSAPGWAGAEVGPPSWQETRPGPFEEPRPPRRPRRSRWIALAVAVLLLGSAGAVVYASGWRPSFLGGTGPTDGPTEGPTDGSTKAFTSVADKAAATKKLTIGMRDFLPGIALDSGGRWSGFEVDLATRIADALGVPESGITFKATRREDRPRLLADGEVDMVISTYSINAQDDVTFAGPYYLAHVDVLVRDDSTISSTAGLEGKRLCRPAGSASTKVVQDEVTDLTLVDGETYTDCMNKLLNGEVDAVPGDDLLLAGFADRESVRYRVVGLKLTDERYAVALKRGDERTCQAIQGVIADLYRKGTIRELLNRHFANVNFPGRENDQPAMASCG
ncbi:protein kinase [Planobispora siamensis]|uniref:non-specific serine/threonine protein kinase n=1 Tax=Planobispora siamensis TaxID=936338 RepID=A0A8J3SH27_9ACTN|nr:bifunctional serine/threonine-protein kinase/glutamate ABC transporter substrate-binding protein [Planobispora siamensis]GIH89563.1 hypothetical protein Psi01_01930 [Planobispora siamensis]